MDRIDPPLLPPDDAPEADDGDVIDARYEALEASRASDTALSALSNRATALEHLASQTVLGTEERRQADRAASDAALAAEVAQEEVAKMREGVANAARSLEILREAHRRAGRALTRSLSGAALSRAERLHESCAVRVFEGLDLVREAQQRLAAARSYAVRRASLAGAL